ncbi:MAG: hypothetical protein JNL81_13185 [Hyphomonadaceae bacterium]|nr:hypothetical protein [Hyphomonadaceae bacterium]
MIIALLAALGLAACTPPATETGSLFETQIQSRANLPDRLREISGLAVSPDGRLFGHDDEVANIYEINPTSGEIVKWFALGDPSRSGDFEGLTITPEGDFWLTDSRGRLFRFREGENEAHVAFERFDTELGEACEIEGVAYQPAEQSLILACKRVRGDDGNGGETQLQAWSIASRQTRQWGPVSGDIAAAAGVRSFAPSGLELDRVSGRLIVISAAGDGALAELGPDGALLAARRLGNGHRQAEGVAIMPDGSLIISDEAGNSQALITRYRRRQ